MILKAQIILYMYDCLIEGKEFTADEITTLYKISARTFRRYIAEINDFLYEQFKGKEVVYSKKRKVYCLRDL